MTAWWTGWYPAGADTPTLEPGVRELAQHILGRPVRYGTPRPLPGMEEFANLPAFSTALGLIAFTRQPSFAAGQDVHDGEGVLNRMVNWVKRHV